MTYQKILMDPSPFYALADDTHAHHHDARELLLALPRSSQLLTLSFAIQAGYRFVYEHFSRAEAQSWLVAILEAEAEGSLAIIYPTKLLHGLVLRTLQRSSDPLSYPTAWYMVTLELRPDIDCLWTFEPHTFPILSLPIITTRRSLL